MNNLNSYHLKQNQYLNCYQPQNKIENNQYGNWNIHNTPAWNNKKEIGPKEYSSKKSPLFIISAGMFKFSSTIKPRPIPLDIDYGLPKIHTRFGTSDTDESTFFTRVDSCAWMNVRNLKLKQWIVTNNPDIVESYIHNTVEFCPWQRK